MTLGAEESQPLPDERQVVSSIRGSAGRCLHPIRGEMSRPYAVIALVVSASCARAGASDSAPVPTSSAGAPFSAATQDDGATAPLESTPEIVALPVLGFLDAVVSVPVGAVKPRPVIVATHGLWDFPEGLCDNWRWIVGNRAWVLCPRGKAMPDKTFRYTSGPALASEIDADLRALQERYPEYVDTGPMLYAGFSLGAILGAWIVGHDPGRYPRAVLTEGGEDRVSDAVAASYAKGGVQRILFACGLASRVRPATQAVRRLDRAGVSARVVLGKLPDAGQFIHWYNGPVAEETKAQLDWLFEGDPRWSP
jgi:hypothetical protein